MKFEDLKKLDNIKTYELNESELEQASGGFYIGPREKVEMDGVEYYGCPSCGEALTSFPCPICGCGK